MLLTKEKGRGIDFQRAGIRRAAKGEKRIT
jgi:hypothetical protein